MLHEADLIGQAKALMEKVSIPLPTDVVVATEFSESAEAVVKPVDQVADNEMILDIGPDTAAHLASLLKDAGTICGNGPVGVFEIDQFGKGTEEPPMPLLTAAHFPLPVAVTRSLRLINTPLPTVPIFPPVAGVFRVR